MNMKLGVDNGRRQVKKWEPYTNRGWVNLLHLCSSMLLVRSDLGFVSSSIHRLCGWVATVWTWGIWHKRQQNLIKIPPFSLLSTEKNSILKIYILYLHSYIFQGKKKPNTNIWLKNTIKYIDLEQHIRDTNTFITCNLAAHKWYGTVVTP